MNKADRIITLLESIDSKLSAKNIEVYTAQEAADFLRINYFTLLDLVKAEKIKYSRIGRNLYFRKEWFLEYLDAGGSATSQSMVSEQKDYKLTKNRKSVTGHGYGQLRPLR